MTIRVKPRGGGRWWAAGLGRLRAADRWFPGASGGAAPGKRRAVSAAGRCASRHPHCLGPCKAMRRSSMERGCLADLAPRAQRFEPLPDTYAAPGCNKLGTVQLSRAGGRPFDLWHQQPRPAAFAVRPRPSATGRVWRGRPCGAARSSQGPIARNRDDCVSYACGAMSQGTERRSAIARAEAIDVSGFVLERWTPHNVCGVTGTAARGFAGDPRVPAGGAQKRLQAFRHSAWPRNTTPRTRIIFISKAPVRNSAGERRPRRARDILPGIMQGAQCSPVVCGTIHICAAAEPKLRLP